MTPLMFASKNGHPSVAEQLIQYGADVNKEDNRGWTVCIEPASTRLQGRCREKMMLSISLRSGIIC